MVWIDYCKKMRKARGPILADAEMTKLFDLLRRSELFISRNVATQICNYYGEGKAKVARVLSINNDFSSKCQHCGSVLKKFRIEDDVRTRIMEILVNFVIKKHDIYLKSSPVEFEKFMSFLKAEGPFDLVVDQPNVSYKPLPQRHSNPFNFSRNLYETVQHFDDLGWKTLLVCRPEVRKFHHYRRLDSLRSVLCHRLRGCEEYIEGLSRCSSWMTTQMTICSYYWRLSTAGTTASSSLTTTSGSISIRLVKLYRAMALLDIDHFSVSRREDCQDILPVAGLSPDLDRPLPGVRGGGTVSGRRALRPQVGLASAPLQPRPDRGSDGLLAPSHQTSTQSKRILPPQSLGLCQD